MGKTKTIIVIEPIQLTQFFMPKIGVEKVVDPGEDYLEVYKEARKEIEAMARESYPEHFHQEKTFINTLTSKVNGNPVAEVQIEKPEPKKTKEKALQEINESTDIRVLETFRRLIQTDEELKKVYDAKMKELAKNLVAENNAENVRR